MVDAISPDSIRKKFREVTAREVDDMTTEINEFLQSRQNLLNSGNTVTWNPTEQIAQTMYDILFNRFRAAGWPVMIIQRNGINIGLQFGLYQAGNRTLITENPGSEREYWHRG